jgi:hypothetical protein
LRRQVVQALSDRLGPIDALRFLALISREPFDYQEWRREYFSQYNVAERLNPSMKSARFRLAETPNWINITARRFGMQPSQFTFPIS